MRRFEDAQHIDCGDCTCGSVWCVHCRGLHDAQDSRTVQTNQVATETETALADLEARVMKMRELGVTRWGGIELGPLPPPSNAGDDETTQRLTAAQVEQRARDERKRIASASSGGPLKRLSADG